MLLSHFRVCQDGKSHYCHALDVEKEVNLDVSLHPKTGTKPVVREKSRKYNIVDRWKWFSQCIPLSELFKQTRVKIYCHMNGWDFLEVIHKQNGFLIK